jgi:hypothetical protein
MFPTPALGVGNAPKRKRAEPLPGSRIAQSKSWLAEHAVSTSAMAFAAATARR